MLISCLLLVILSYLFNLALVAIFLIIIVFILYSYLGYRLNKNFIAWGFIGLGILASIPLVTSPFLLIINFSINGLVYWTTISVCSIIFTFLAALLIAYRYKLFLK